MDAQSLTVPAYTLAEAAANLRISRRTVRRLLAKGQLPGVRLGRDWRIPRIAIEALRSGHDWRGSP